MASNASNITISLFGKDVSLASTLDKASKASGAATTQIEGHGKRIRGALTGAFSSLSSTGILGEYQGSIDQLTGAVGGLGEAHAAMGQKLMGAGAAIAGAGVLMSSLASTDQASQQQLAASIVATGGTYDQYKDKIEKTISSQEKFGHTANETQDALATLTQATNSPSKELANMGLVANLAAARHESLTEAATQVAKILAGKGAKTFAEYGITVATTGNKTKNLQLATEQLAAKLNGQAAAAADTFKGKLDAAKAKITDVASAVAGKLGPALTVAGPIIATAGSVMEIMASRAESAAAKQAALGAASTESATEISAASDEVVASDEAVTVASEESGEASALAFGPIGLAIAALVIAITLLVTHWKAVWADIKAVTSAVFSTLKAIFSDVIGFITSHWKVFAEALATILLGPLGLVVAYVATHFTQVKNTITSILNAIKSFFVGTWNSITGALSTALSWISSHVSSMVSTFTGLPGRFKGLFVGMFDGIKDAFRGAINFVIGGWDSLKFTMPGVNTHIPGVGKIGGFTVGVPHIPLLAAGGVVSSPTLAMIGEGREREYVIPESKLGNVSPLPSAAGSMTSVAAPVTIQVVLDGKVIAESTHRVLLQKKNRGVQIGLS